MKRSLLLTRLERRDGSLSAGSPPNRTRVTPMRTAISLLTAAEQALRLGRTADAIAIFQQISHLHPGTLESVAALAYLRSAKRRPPRRASLQ